MIDLHETCGILWCGRDKTKRTVTLLFFSRNLHIYEVNVLLTQHRESFAFEVVLVLLHENRKPGSIKSLFGEFSAHVLCESQSCHVEIFTIKTLKICQSLIEFWWCFASRNKQNKTSGCNSCHTLFQQTTHFTRISLFFYRLDDDNHIKLRKVKMVFNWIGCAQCALTQHKNHLENLCINRIAAIQFTKNNAWFKFA